MTTSSKEGAEEGGEEGVRVEGVRDQEVQRPIVPLFRLRVVPDLSPVKPRIQRGR